MDFLPGSLLHVDYGPPAILPELVVTMSLESPEVGKIVLRPTGNFSNGVIIAVETVLPFLENMFNAWHRRSGNLFKTRPIPGLCCELEWDSEQREQARAFFEAGVGHHVGRVFPGLACKVS